MVTVGDRLRAKGRSLSSQTVPDTYPAGLAEPINVIISNHSSPRVLADTMSNGGLYNYMMAVGQAPECMGFHMGNKQSADLGDGAGLSE